MNADWTTSPSAHRVLQHLDDQRPAWLWSQDGRDLLWHNDAAKLFLAKLKKHGLKRAAPAQPIKGQIARNIRLGSPGRTSLARIQFLAGEKPASATCATTPLLWEHGQFALLIVGVDAIDRALMDAARIEAAQVDDANGTDTEVIEPATLAERPDTEAPRPEPADSESDPVELAAFTADQAEETPEIAIGPDLSVHYEHETEPDDLSLWHDSEAEQTNLTVVPTNPVAETVSAADTETPDGEADADAEGTASDAPPNSRLSRLFDRLSTDEALFSPLTDADDNLLEPPVPDDVAAPETPSLFRVTGRGFVDDAEEAPSAEDMPSEKEPVEAEAPPQLDADPIVEPTAEMALGAEQNIEAVERTSRYNFDELSRLLNDRIGEGGRPTTPPAISQPSGALVNLGGETLVLNRLPLGILVFRDQQVLFANRAITEMVGYSSVENLRSAGLAAVFPAAGPEGQEAGPVNHLVQRDGTLVPVTARLQSISWQGRPALMLSASATEVRTGHEAAVRDFARTFADLRGDGFLETTRSGVISEVTARAAQLMAPEGEMLEGRPLSGLISSSDLTALRELLERPARFADTSRPCVTLRAATGRAELTLFAQGQAGVVTGYFGFVRSREVAPIQLTTQSDLDPALLARVSRGVRRPLNTIVGFSDLIRSEAFGALGNERYEGYAQDIATAGQEIAALVDELDDYARLRDGRYLPQRASIELTSLLESCVIRIRQQANGARVIVRNAISERLPKVTADRASLSQAVLNLLASAIDQTPAGAAVVISANHQDDGGIAIHVRDSSTKPVDMAERFVVFRDGVGRDGQTMGPVRSSVGLALTRSLLAVNTVALSVDPAGEKGMLFTLTIPADLVDRRAAIDPAE